MCDAPAQAHLQCVLGHTAKKGCSYCDAEVRYLIDCIVFPVETGHHRSDEDYKNMSQNNQTKLSPLVSIVGLNTHFPVDELHCVCLGVFRRICFYLFSRVKNVKISGRVKGIQLSLLSEEIEHFRKFIPCEFQRKVRPISDLLHYKGTEYRTLLLYFAPFLFKKYLPNDVFDHLMCLHFSYYIFSSNEHSRYYDDALYYCTGM